MNVNVTEEFSDFELIEALKSDSRDALGIIYNRYAEKMYKASYSLIADKAACEDIVHEIFVNVWISRAKLEVRSLQNYLIVASKNHALSILRKTNPVADITEFQDYLTDSIPVDNTLTMHEINRIVAKNVERLPRKCQQIFLLSREEQLPHKEIAARLNITVKTVENQIAIALKRIRNSLQNLT